MRHRGLNVLDVYDKPNKFLHGSNRSLVDIYEDDRPSNSVNRRKRAPVLE